ncbi:MAG TPA: type II/IV secretion system protein, partial [Polyangia bacterium]|nr:type II/IV secretion system protein [Polyangia bacterium]
MTMQTHRITVDELTALLAEQGLLTEEQQRDVKVRAESQRARLRIAGAGSVGRSDGSAGEPTAAEVIASLGLVAGGQPGGATLDEDRVMRCLADKSGLPFEKIDPLKVDAALVTSTLSFPFARRHSVLPLRRQGTS